MVFQYFGLDAFLRIISHLLFIYLSFWALQTLNLETLFRKKQGQTRQIRIVFVFLSIAIGYNVSSFFMEFIILLKNILGFTI